MQASVSVALCMYSLDVHYVQFGCLPSLMIFSLRALFLSNSSTRLPCGKNVIFWVILPENHALPERQLGLDYAFQTDPELATREGDPLFITRRPEQDTVI